MGSKVDVRSKIKELENLVPSCPAEHFERERKIRALLDLLGQEATRSVERARAVTTAASRGDCSPPL